MDRWACLDIPALALQILIARNRDWAGQPVVLVEREAPQGKVVQITRQARLAGVRRGMRFAAALGIAPHLRAGVVPPEEIDRVVEEIAARLLRYTPGVEPARGAGAADYGAHPGAFWLDAGGLDTLFGSAAEWARRIVADLESTGYRAAVAVGSTRFGAYALARTHAAVAEGRVAVFPDPEAERAAALAVPLGRLDLDPALVDGLEVLGVNTVEEFLRLPANGLRRRFGESALAFHRRTSGDLWAPLRPVAEAAPLVERGELDYPETDSARLVLVIERLLDPLLRALARQGSALALARWTLHLDDGKRREFEIRPAAPMLDARIVLDLVRLRLESVELPAGAVEIHLMVEGTAAPIGQIELFRDESRRDLRAADRALARIRAEFGPDAAVHAALVDGHLPEARFRWEPLATMRPAHPIPIPLGPATPLVRRLYARPVPIPPADRRALEPAAGPYVVSGGWWVREVHREYHFAAAPAGRLLWVYYDRPRDRWFVQGEVM